jgi:hypothetical protein
VKLRYLASLFVLAFPIATCAQTDLTCHITPFSAPSGSGLGMLNSAVSINRYGNSVGNDHRVVNGNDSETPYIRYSNGIVQKMPISIPNAPVIEPKKRNASGVTVGRYQTASPATVGGFVNSGTKTTVFHVPNTQNTNLSGINRYGTMVGNYFGDSSGQNGIFKYKNGTITVLHPPQTFFRETETTGISDTGVIVGNYALADSPPDPDQTTHGFLIVNGTWQDFAYPGRLDTYIYDINASGMIVGALDDSKPDFTFVYKNGKFYHPVFVLPNGTKQSSNAVIYGVNGYGQISGGINTGGSFKPFVGSCSF